MGMIAFGRKLNADETALLSKYKITSEADFVALDNALLRDSFYILAGEKSIHLTVDGSGSFKRSLPVGTYNVCIRSSHRKVESEPGRLMEFKGKLQYERIEVKAGEESDITAKFDMY